MTFRITGLDPAPFRHLFHRSDEYLAKCGARRVIADKAGSFPDRVEMRDADIGEALLLLNYTHQPADTPYRSSHAIFVREGAEHRYDETGAIPAVIRSRLISLRAFDHVDEMAQAEIIDGIAIEPVIARMLSEPHIAYLHAHYATRGCYAARIERAGQR